MANNPKELTRININIPTPMANRVKEYAQSTGVNVTNAYIMLINQALEQRDMLNNMPILMKMLEQAKDLAVAQQNSDLISDDKSRKES